MFSTVNKEHADRFLYLRRRAEVLNIIIEMSDHAGLDTKKFYDMTVERNNILSELAGAEFKLLSDFVTSNALLLSEEDNVWGFVYESKHKAGRRKVWVMPIRKGVTKEELEEIASRKKFSPEQDLVMVKDYDVYQREYTEIQREALSIVQGKDVPVVHFKAGGTQSLLVTYHAMRRWIERVANINHFPIPQELRSGIFRDIQEDFKRASFVYHSDSRNADYYFNEDSLIIYCVKSGNMLISLWKNSFQPFEYDKIKHQIVIYQLEYITNIQKSIYAKRKNIANKVNEQENAIRQAEAEVEHLEEQLSAIQKKIDAKKQFIEELQTAKQDTVNEVEKMEEKLREQEDILFTKTDVNTEDEEELSVAGSISTKNDDGDEEEKPFAALASLITE